MLASDVRFFHRGFSRPRTLPTLFVASRPCPGFYLHLAYRLLHANVAAVAGITRDVIAEAVSAVAGRGAFTSGALSSSMPKGRQAHWHLQDFLPISLATLSPFTPTEARAAIAISCDGLVDEVHPQCANTSSPVPRATLPQLFACQTSYVHDTFRLLATSIAYPDLRSRSTTSPRVLRRLPSRR